MLEKHDVNSAKARPIHGSKNEFLVSPSTVMLTSGLNLSPEHSDQF